MQLCITVSVAMPVHVKQPALPGLMLIATNTVGPGTRVSVGLFINGERSVRSSWINP